MISSIIQDIEISLSTLIKDEEAIIVYDKIERNEMVTIKSYLYSILYNLILNSLKYRRKEVRPIIEISSKVVEGKLQLLVKDNGLGIDLKKKEIRYSVYISDFILKLQRERVWDYSW